jgi:hypothetical protein
MKKIYLLFAMVFCVLIVNAQEEEKQVKNDEFKTIFGGKKFGGYGGIGLGYTVVDDKNAVIFNARGAAILNHWLALGLMGAGFVNEKSYNEPLSENVSLVGGYGGILIEPIIFPKSGVHLSFPIIAGVGGVSFTTFNDQIDQQYKSNNIETSQSVFIFEPGAELEFNLFKFMRMSLFATYRFATDLNLEYTSKMAMNGASVGLNMKFGKF